MKRGYISIIIFILILLSISGAFAASTPTEAINEYRENLDSNNPETLIAGTQYDRRFGNGAEEMREFIYDLYNDIVESSDAPSGEDTDLSLFSSEATIEYYNINSDFPPYYIEKFHEYGIYPDSFADVFELDIRGDFYAVISGYAFSVNGEWYYYDTTDLEKLKLEADGAPKIEPQAAADITKLYGSWILQAFTDEYGREKFLADDFGITIGETHFVFDASGNGSIYDTSTNYREEFSYEIEGSTILSGSVFDEFGYRLENTNSLYLLMYDEMEDMSFVFHLIRDQANNYHNDELSEEEQVMVQNLKIAAAELKAQLDVLNDQRNTILSSDNLSDIDRENASQLEITIKEVEAALEQIYCQLDSFGQSAWDTDEQTPEDTVNVTFTFDEVKMLGGNVAAYRIGELWGTVLSDGTIVTDPTYTECFRDIYTGQGEIYGLSYTLIGVQSTGYFILSDETGEEVNPWITGGIGGGIYWSTEYNQLVTYIFGESMEEYHNHSGGMKVYSDYPFDTYTLIGNDGQPLYISADQIYLADSEYSQQGSSTTDQNSLALVLDNDQCYQVDYYGNITGFGDNAKAYLDHIAPYQSGGQWGYIDDYGTVIIECKYDDATSLGYYEGRYYAWVKNNESWYVIWFQDGTVIDNTFSTIASDSVQPFVPTPTQTPIETETPKPTATPNPSEEPLIATLTNAELPPEYVDPEEDFQSTGLVQCNYPIVSLIAGIYYADGTETQLVTTVYPFTYEYDIENITTISSLSALNDGPYLFKVSIETDETTKELVSSPFFIGGEELQKILRFAGNVENMNVFNELNYYQEYLDDIGKVQAWWITMNLGFDLYATQFIGLFDNTDDSRYQINLYKESIKETVVTLYPDEASMDTSGAEIYQYIANAITLEGKMSMANLAATLPDNMSIPSDMMSALLELESLVNTTDIISNIFGNLDIFVDFLETFVKDYEQGLLVLKTISTAMGETGNSAYSTAMSEVILEYRNKWIDRLNTVIMGVFEEVTKAALEESLKTILEIGLSGSYSLYTFCIDTTLMVMGGQDTADTAMQFVSAAENFQRARIAYRNAFFNVYINENHSVTALKTLKACFDYTLASCQELYDCLYWYIPHSKIFVFGSEQSDVLTYMNKYVNSINFDYIVKYLCN